MSFVMEIKEMIPVDDVHEETMWMPIKEKYKIM